MTEVSVQDLRSGRFPCRWLVAINCFFALFFSYVLRLDFSVAIVCMVKPANGSASFLNSTTKLNTSFSLVPTSQDRCGQLGSESKLTGQAGEFEWSKNTQAELLAAFSYGYIATQILGGWLARRYGTRRILGLAMMVTVLATLLSPVSARTHISLLFVVRIITGLSQGVTLPAVYNLAARWAPPLERSRFVAISMAGYASGYVASFGISGFLCAYGFDRGWGSIFYTFGIAAVLWLVFWFYIVYDTPADHPRISQEEKTFLENNLGTLQRRNERNQATPWFSICTSPPFWAMIFAYLAVDWINYTLQLGLIVYMKEVLRYDIMQNGMISSLPFIGDFVVGFFISSLADWIQKRRWLSTVNTRRLFHLVSFIGMGTFMGVTGWVSCEDRSIAVLLLTMSRIMYSFSRGGYCPNVMDFAPRYAGEITGILNTVSTIPGFVAPLIMGWLTPNGTQDEWMQVFYVAGAMALFGTVGFVVLTRGEIQKWARTTETDQELTINMNTNGCSSTKREKMQLDSTLDGS